jgi:hypothetical protein
MGYLTRDAILSQVEFPTGTVDVPEWGGELLVRGMSAWERERFEQLQEMFKNNSKLDSLSAQVICWCAIDEHGKPLFSAKDVAELGALSAAPFERILKAVVRLTVFGEMQNPEDEVADAKANFTADQIESSSSS